MDKQEIELIKNMVVHGIYKVCIINGYDSTMFKKFKKEQERIFDNYILNKSILEEREKNLLENWESDLNSELLEKHGVMVKNKMTILGGAKYEKFLKRIADIPNALRVLEIMDECGGVDIEKVTRDGLDKYDYWVIKPKRYISKKDAEDLRKITLFQEHYYKRNSIWKIVFPDVRDGYRFL